VPEPDDVVHAVSLIGTSSFSAGNVASAILPMLCFTPLLY
jgi:hypothetical protein